MRLGFISSILDSWSFEEMLGVASDLDFKCVEVACWPSGKAERRYAGVSHIDVHEMKTEKAACIADSFAHKGIEISSLAFYPNTLDPEPEKRAANIDHLKQVILASEMLSVGMVTTFIGRDQFRTVDENFEIFKRIWPDIISFAEDHAVRIAIENCPMLFGKDQWPGGQNLASTPAIWERMFDAIPSKNFGLNYDPSHMVWQMIDYIQPLYEFRDKIFHVHFKDVRLYRDKLARLGTMAYPLDYMAPKIPGYGDVDWRRYVSALSDIGFDGCACIEIEDRAFEGGREKILDSLRVSKRYLDQFIY